MTGVEISFDKVACLRGDRLLFEDLDFSLSSGDAAVVSGPNGAGKSSLLRLAAGLLRPAAGRIRRSGDVAWLGEQPALDAHLPLGRALDYWRRVDGTHADALTAAAEAMDVAPLFDVPVRMLSTGQRRRAGLARVMLGNAPIWLLDEPGNGLDTGALALLESAITAHRAKGGIVLVATHQPLAIEAPRSIALERR